MRERGFAVESVCAVLREQGCQIAARTYRAWTAGRPPAARDHSDAVVIVVLRATADQPEPLYGRRKMTAHLRRQDLAVAHFTVNRLMRDLGMNGVRRAKSVRTTLPGKDGRRAGDLLDRDFPAPAPNRARIADFTYVRTWAEFVYVAFVVDVYAQTIVGWHALATKHTELVLTALRTATWRRGHQGDPVGAGLIHHSDAGSQYTSLHFTEHLALEGIAPSIGSVGDAYDNALMKSVIGLYKTECVHRCPFHTGPLRTLADVEYATATSVEWWNHARLHSTLGYRTPAEHEADNYAAITASQPEPRPV
jgi:putative transposase